MKESEYHKRQLHQLTDDDNVFKFFNIYKKIRRAEAKERFDEKILPLIQAKYNVDILDNKYIIFSDKYVIDYFPKANKFLIRSSNRWVNGYSKMLKLLGIRSER